MILTFDDQPVETINFDDIKFKHFICVEDTFSDRKFMIGFIQKVGGWAPPDPPNFKDMSFRFLSFDGILNANGYSGSKRSLRALLEDIIKNVPTRRIHVFEHIRDMVQWCKQNDCTIGLCITR